MIEKLPWLDRYYRDYSAQLKRAYCLGLHRLGRLKPISFVQWLATSQCNLHCPYCEASAGSAAQDELTEREARALLDDLGQFRVKRLVISGGEPLMRPDLPALMLHANDRRMQIGLVSNGLLVEKRWKELAPIHFYLYFTSIDGLPAAHDQLRGKTNAFDLTLKSLERFYDKKVHTRIVNTVVQPSNLDQLEGLLPLLLASAATHWRLTPLTAVGRAAGQSQYQFNSEQLRTLVDFVQRQRGKGRLKIDLGESHSYLECFTEQPGGKPFFCGAGLTRCSIMPNGDVSGCHQVYKGSLMEGNIRERPFSEIWRKGFVRFRNKSMPASCAGCSHLKRCHGGCWAEMENQPRCLKAIWEENELKQ
jgi:radical SAM protein with 4Fe4S-binding SPASM domain